MAKLSKFKVDTSKIEEGVWQHLADGIEVRVRSKRYAPYTEAVLARLGELRKKHPTGAPNEEIRRVEKEAAGEFLLCGIRGAENDDGEPLEYTPEWGKATLADPEFVELFEFVDSISDRGAPFRVDQAAGK